MGPDVPVGSDGHKPAWNHLPGYGQGDALRGGTDYALIKTQLFPNKQMIPTMKKKISLAAVALLTAAMQLTGFAQTAPTRVNTENDTATGKRKLGDPYAVLPSNIERLTYFGERADISPDNK